MTKLISKAVFSRLLLLALLLPVPSAMAQSGTRNSTQAHYNVLWSWLNANNYKQWNGVDGRPPSFQEGDSPHGALIKTYISPKTASNLTDLPDGSVIVKENFSPDKKLMAITVMHRSAGFDPKHGDWYYAKYTPNGQVEKTPPEMKSMPIAGKFMMCTQCHSGAGGGDFAFFND